MKILVTGGAGFIGSHLCERLISHGHEVVVLDDLSTGSRAHLAPAEAGGRLRLVQGDVSDARLVADVMAGCGAVFHLAAAVGVRLILEHPTRTIETNVTGTASVLHAAARSGLPVLVTSTSEVYGKTETVPFREDDDVVLGATHRKRWGYAASKMVDEFLALAYHSERQLPVVIVRLFNTVGPRQTGRYGMVIPRLVSQALAGQPLTVYGDGLQSRCFGAALDIIDALEKLIFCPLAYGQVINLGNPEEITILDLARLILQVTGSKSPIQLVPYDEAFTEGFEDMRRRVPEISKAARLVGFRPTTSVRTIIEQVTAEQRGAAPR